MRRGNEEAPLLADSSDESSVTNSKDIEMNSTIKIAPHMPGTLKHKNSNANLEGVNTKAAEQAKALSSCALYSFCSVSMILVNKSLASR